MPAPSAAEWRRDATDAAAASGAPEVEIVERDRTLVVALRHRGEYLGLAQTYGQVFGWAHQSGLIAGLKGIYGVPLDDPESVPAPDLRYEACLALGDVSAPSPFHILALPSGETARWRHIGSYAGLDQAMQHLIEEWLLPSGREPADHPIYSQFLNDPADTPEAELITDLYLPLRA